MIPWARVRRAFRRETIGVDVAATLNLVGALLKYLSLAFLFPIGVAIVYGEPILPFAVGGAITGAVGVGLERLTRGKEEVGTREGFLIVALTWVFAAAAFSLPYVLSSEDQLARPVDAFFEAMSGVTTTGASVLTDVEALNHSLAMWRQFSQWVGGMGIIVLAIAVLPRLRVGGRQLFQSELPGPTEMERLTVSIRETARRLWILYVGLTALEAAFLAVIGWTGVDDELNLFEAVAHAFSTMPTGGFSTQARSIETFAPLSQWVIIVFIVAAGTNFALMYRALLSHRPAALPRDGEFRLYIGFLVMGSAVLLLELIRAGLFAGEEAIRTAVFQSATIVTSTGFANADFNQWTSLTAMTLIALMFVGGSAASTGGGVKVIRHLVLAKTIRRELDQTIHPEVVRLVHYNRRPIDERIVRSVITFVLLYMLLFLIGALVITVESTRAGVPVTPVEAITASASTLGNIGPGLGFLGPMGSYEPFSDLAKVTMIALMWLGRLEIIPIVALFTKAYWRA